MVSFRAWIRSRIALPLFGVGIVLLLSQVLFISFLLKSDHQKKDDLVDRFAGITLRSITTHQYGILDQLAAVAMNESELSLIVLCADAQSVSWSYPISVAICEANSLKRSGLIIRSVFKNQEYPKLLFHFPLFSNLNVLLLVGVIAFLTVVGGIFLLFRIRHFIIQDLHIPTSMLASGSVQFQISELEKMRTDLLESHEREKQQTKMVVLGKIATQVAHDIRSPLSSIQSAVGLLKDPHSSKDDALNLLELSSKRIEGIANDLLEKHKGGEKKKSIFSLHRILDELIGELESSPLSKGITFKKEYGSALYAYGDRSKLQRVFGNIVKNGLEALRAGGAVSLSNRGALSITLKTFVEGEYSVLQIIDNGPGMSPETLEKILHGGFTAGKKDGHGIGMKVVKETIEEHLGKLEGESSLGKGTTFTIKLPLPESAMIKNAKGMERGVGIYNLTLPFISSPPLGGESERGGGIIVIDDDAGMRLQWELLLKKEGCEVYSFDSYESYKESSLSGPLSTAIIDYHYENSELNGLQILEKLQKEGFTHLTLCTAEYWKPGIQEEAKRLKVPICPKPLPKITFHIDSSPSPQREMESHKENGYTVLVIDDDKLIGITWKSMKKSLKIKDLYYFPNLEKCLEAKINFAQIDIAFVDKNIEGSDYDGESTMAYLKKQNLNKVLMATGESGTKIPKSIKDLLLS